MGTQQSANCEPIQMSHPSLEDPNFEFVARTQREKVRASPTGHTKSLLNVLTGRSGHFLISNGVHQTSVDTDICPKFHKPVPDVEVVCGSPDTLWTSLGPTINPLFPLLMAP